MVYPLMNDSADSAMYQKHYEKQSRLDAVFNSRENSCETGDIDAEEVRFALIRDPQKRARAMIKQEQAALDAAYRLAKSTAEKITHFASERKGHAYTLESSNENIEKIAAFRKENGKLTDGEFQEKHNIRENSYYGGYSVWLSDIGLPLSGRAEGSTIKELRGDLEEGLRKGLENEKRDVRSAEGKIATIDSVLARYHIKDMSAESIEAAVAGFEREAEGVKAKWEEVSAALPEYTARAAEQIKRETFAGERAGKAAIRISDEICGNIRPFVKKKRRTAEHAQEAAPEAKPERRKNAGMEM
jgi:hypothetical protein